MKKVQFLGKRWKLNLNFFLLNYLVFCCCISFQSNLFFFQRRHTSLISLTCMHGILNENFLSSSFYFLSYIHWNRFQRNFFFISFLIQTQTKMKENSIEKNVFNRLKFRFEFLYSILLNKKFLQQLAACLNWLHSKRERDEEEIF